MLAAGTGMAPATGPPSTMAALPVPQAGMGQDVAPITLEPPQTLQGPACLGAGTQRRSCARTERPLFTGEFIASIVQAESRDAQSGRQPGLGCPKGRPWLQRDPHPRIANDSGFSDSPSTPTTPGNQPFRSFPLPKPNSINSVTVMPGAGTPLSPTQARARPQAGPSSFPGCAVGLFGWSAAIPHPSAQEVGEDFSIRPDSLFEGFTQQVVSGRNQHSKRGKIRVRIPAGGRGL